MAAPYPVRHCNPVQRGSREGGPPRAFMGIVAPMVDEQAMPVGKYVGVFALAYLGLFISVVLAFEPAAEYLYVWLLGCTWVSAIGVANWFVQTERRYFRPSEYKRILFGSTVVVVGPLLASFLMERQKLSSLSIGAVLAISFVVGIQFVVFAYTYSQGGLRRLMIWPPPRQNPPAE